MTKLTVHYVATVSAQTLNHRSAFDKISEGSENKTMNAESVALGNRGDIAHRSLPT